MLIFTPYFESDNDSAQNCAWLWCVWLKSHASKDPHEIIQTRENTNWMDLLLDRTHSNEEIVIVGELLFDINIPLMKDIKVLWLVDDVSSFTRIGSEYISLIKRCICPFLPHETIYSSLLKPGTLGKLISITEYISSVSDVAIGDWYEQQDGGICHCSNLVIRYKLIREPIPFYRWSITGYTANPIDHLRVVACIGKSNCPKEHFWLFPKLDEFFNARINALNLDRVEIIITNKIRSLIRYYLSDKGGSVRGDSNEESKQKQTDPNTTFEGLGTFTFDTSDIEWVLSLSPCRNDLRKRIGLNWRSRWETIYYSRWEQSNIVTLEPNGNVRGSLSELIPGGGLVKIRKFQEGYISQAELVESYYEYEFWKDQETFDLLGSENLFSSRNEAALFCLSLIRKLSLREKFHKQSNRALETVKLSRRILFPLHDRKKLEYVEAVALYHCMAISGDEMEWGCMDFSDADDSLRFSLNKIWIDWIVGFGSSMDIPKDIPKDIVFNIPVLLKAAIALACRSEYDMAVRILQYADIEGWKQRGFRGENEQWNLNLLWAFLNLILGNEESYETHKQYTMNSDITYSDQFFIFDRIKYSKSHQTSTININLDTVASSLSLLFP